MNLSANNNNSRIRTGLFGGSFNPVHYGHINLAKFILEKGLVDEIWFIVSPRNPLKPDADPEDADKRLEAVKQALSYIPNTFASDIEFTMPYPSFTVDTVKKAIADFPEREFVLIIGGDNLDVFTKWKDYEFFLNNIDIIVYPRNGAINKIPAGWDRIIMLEAPLMDISSTMIRENRQKDSNLF
jgi:nicotinate-nucleotide adenylyltransferase